MKSQKLPRTFYERPNVVQIAKELLGKTLFTSIEGVLSGGIITEVEAYSGTKDKACHAHNGKRTARTEVMFGVGGHSYVYLCYGIHHMFNVVTNAQGHADAVLIRAIEPTVGMDEMLRRRNKAKLQKTLTAGPGALGQALGLHFKEHNGLDLLGDTIWIEDAPNLNEDDIFVTTRIGVDYAEEDALKPWRFYIKDNSWISKK